MPRVAATRRLKKKGQLQSQLSTALLFAPVPIILILAMMPVLFSDPGDKAIPPRFIKPKVPPALIIKKATTHPPSNFFEKVELLGVNPIAHALSSPDGLAIDPATGVLAVCEETANQIVTTGGGSISTLISADTPVFVRQDEGLVRTLALRAPEGLAFSQDGSLYVTEDIPGGRLIRFPRGKDGAYRVGEVIPIPGNWNYYAWESVDISPMGEILLAGSDVEAIDFQDDGPAFPSGSIVYRDRNGDWWIPYQRLFSSFSSVAFSREGKRAVYSCELTGEIGWFDLQTHQPLGGTLSFNATSPESVKVLANGTVIVVEEPGNIFLVDPASNRVKLLYEGENLTIETAIWNPVSKSILVSDDFNGRILELHVNMDLAEGPDRLAWAPFQPLFTTPEIPEGCPDYLARVLALGGLDYTYGGQPQVSFRTFASRVPLIAADVLLTPMSPSIDVSDPCRRLQFVVFNPNKVAVYEDRVSMPFAGFILSRASGAKVKTKMVSLASKVTALEEPRFMDAPDADLTLPLPATINVSPRGITTIQFLGMGETPDYSLVLNPRRPADSYMVVFRDDGSREHYLLSPPNEHAMAPEWVIAYSGARLEEWQGLSVQASEQAMRRPQDAIYSGEL